jgi:hypothetical protein|tara:strand:- start:291 stop:587 length:297 start_codon:yes stop_codon:yes gene_type:complete
MLDTPDAVLLYIPLMKGLGMSWTEIKQTTRGELEGLLGAMYEHEHFHSMDGYSDDDVSELAKNRPEVRHQYRRYLETRRRYNDMLNVKPKQSFGGINK